MMRSMVFLCAALFLLPAAARAQPPAVKAHPLAPNKKFWHEQTGEGPWWKTFTERSKDPKREPERLQKYWHDYYHALKRYYDQLDRIDWATYYKKRGYPINAACSSPSCSNCARVNYAPVRVSPTLQWAFPNGTASGPPKAPALPKPAGPMR